MCVDFGWRTFLFGANMENDFNRYEKINIHSLRNIARKIGVKSPTTLKKKELIEEILLIESGKKPPCATKRGRNTNIRIEDKVIDNEKFLIELNSSHVKDRIKEELIENILIEIRKKLYELL